MRQAPANSRRHSAWRLLQGGGARWVAAGHLQPEPAFHAGLADLDPADPVLPRSGAGPSHSGRARARTGASADPQLPDRQSCLRRRLGASMPRIWRTSWAHTKPTSWPGLAISSRCCSGRPGWWSIPASIPSAGRASRQSPTSSKQPACRARAMENEVDRYTIWPGQACAYMAGRETIRRLRETATAGAWRGVRRPGLP